MPLPPGTKTSILEKAKPAADIEMSKNYLIKACLLGPSGSGKTQSSITLPLLEGKPILLIDFDGRSETVIGEPNVNVLRLYEEDPKSPRAWDDAEALRKELWALARKGDFPYSGVIEDGLSAMGNIAMNSALVTDAKRGLGGAPAMQHYIPQIYYLKTHIGAMRNLPCHYVLNAHIDVFTDEEGGMRLLPKVTKSLRTELPSWFNETYRTHSENVKGETHYYWTTSGTGLYDFMKSTINNKGKYWKDPFRIDFSDPLVGFKKLMKLRFGEKS